MYDFTHINLLYTPAELCIVCAIRAANSFSSHISVDGMRNEHSTIGWERNECAEEREQCVMPNANVKRVKRDRPINNHISRTLSGKTRYKQIANAYTTHGFFDGSMPNFDKIRSNVLPNDNLSISSYMYAKQHVLILVRQLNLRILAPHIDRHTIQSFGDCEIWKTYDTNSLFIWIAMNFVEYLSDWNDVKTSETKQRWMVNCHASVPLQRKCSHFGVTVCARRLCIAHNFVRWRLIFPCLHSHSPEVVIFLSLSLEWDSNRIATIQLSKMHQSKLCLWWWHIAC